MSHKEIADLMQTKKIAGVLVTVDQKGGINYSATCDTFTLMSLKSFLDYNCIKVIDKSLRQNQAMETPPSKLKLNLGK